MCSLQASACTYESGSIPTCAGQPESPSGVRSWQVHGLSPRVRGSPLMAPGCASCCLSVYPHVCGAASGCRSNPHVCGAATSDRYWVLRSIPTCAGQPQHRRLAAQMLQPYAVVMTVYPHVCGAAGGRYVLPHVCGAAVISTMAKTPGCGLSPRVRGSRRLGIGHRHSGLSPRVRGSQSCKYWGYPHVYDGVPIVHGSIPTCAGQPQGARRSIPTCGAWTEVYPHVCGAARSVR